MGERTKTKVNKRVITMIVKIEGAELEIRWTNITNLNVDAIVNAARETLTGGGGVDGMIHAAAGTRLRLACEALEILEVDFTNTEIRAYPGEAYITGGFDLPCRHVIHTVGPRICKGDVPSAAQVEILENCYRNSMSLASSEVLSSIAFPCIAAGLFNFPLDKAAEVACREVVSFLSENPETSIKKVVFCCFGAKEEKAYGENLTEVLRAQSES